MFAARLPEHSKTSATPAAMASVAASVIVIDVVVVSDVSAVPMLTVAPPVFSNPVHVGVCPVTQIALCVPPAVNVIVPLLPIAVVVVAFSVIFNGVSPIVVSSTSPSIAVIADTVLYDVAKLGAASVLETPVVVIAVIVSGFVASSLAVLHVRMTGFWGAVDAAPVNVMVMVSAAMVAVVVAALTKTSVLSVCVSVQPLSVAGVAAHIDEPVFVKVIHVGAVVVVVCGVHVRITFDGVVPSVPTPGTCVAEVARVPCVYVM